ncbi:MAG: helix-turn-helix domain-containing protein [Phycisphaerales bacterium]|nr:helix-turn-helix domain-containing protein [Phycisphaerales bacterium]
MRETAAEIEARYLGMAPAGKASSKKVKPGRTGPKRRSRKVKCWTLAKVWATCPSAVAVWLALREIAAEKSSRVLTPTREMIAVRTGIERRPTISRALTTLENAGWIARAHVPVTVGTRRAATLLRIVLCRRERSTFLTAAAP